MRYAFAEKYMMTTADTHAISTEDHYQERSSELTSKAEGDAGRHGPNPRRAPWHDVRWTRPPEDEERDGHEPAPEHHTRQTVLGVRPPALRGGAAEVVALDAGGDEEGECDADEDGEGVEVFAWSEVASIFTNAPRVMLMWIPLFFNGLTVSQSPAWYA